MKRTDLHEYQNYCVEFLKTHREAMLILEMGLGKSAVTLTAILDLMFDSFDVGKVLVIAPLRVAKTVWPEERDTWEHANFLRMSVMVGSAKQREAALRTPADIYIINRENVKWLIDLLEKRHMPWPFDMVVIDELSSFKNHQSQRWKALRKVRPQIRRMVGLTGTPASNGLMDLWAETFLIDKGVRLGRFIGRYREAYFRAAGMNPYTGIVYNYIPLPGAEEAIYSKISDISVSMKALDYLDMPEQVTVNHWVEMDAAERQVYDDMKGKNRHSGVHLLSGRIKCGDCGGWYGSKVWHSPEKCKRTVWQCNQKYKNEVRCTTPYLDEASVKERFTVAVNQLLAGRDAAIAAYELGMARTLDTTELEAQQQELLSEMEVLNGMIQQMIRQNATVAQDQTEYNKRFDALGQKFKEAEAKKDTVAQQISDIRDRRGTMEDFLRILKQQDGEVTEFSEQFWCGLLDYATAYADGRLTFTFKNGSTFEG